MQLSRKSKDWTKQWRSDICRPQYLADVLFVVHDELVFTASWELYRPTQALEGIVRTQYKSVFGCLDMLVRQPKWHLRNSTGRGGVIRLVQR